ncbi:MAG: hypothetical protein QM775_27130 [Pirellulales bacterium]
MSNSEKVPMPSSWNEMRNADRSFGSGIRCRASLIGLSSRVWVSSVACWLVFASLLWSTTGFAAEPQRRPNVVLCLADDK